LKVTLWRFQTDVLVRNRPEAVMLHHRRMRLLCARIPVIITKLAQRIQPISAVLAGIALTTTCLTSALSFQVGFVRLLQL